LTTASAKQMTPRRVSLRQKTARASRWLHIYLSMVSFAIVLFFSVTGLTLNHQEWFEKDVKTAVQRGTMPSAVLGKPNELRIVEFLRNANHVSGAVGELRVDESEVTVSFRGPGYSADATIDRANGRYEIVETRNGFWAVMNDLHKGRDTGKVWKAVIDLSAVLLTLVSLTGLVLIFFLYKKRVAGLMLAAAGLVMSVLIYRFLIP
jgi:hypothetical protein